MLTLSTTGFTDTRYFDCSRFSPLRIVLVAAAHLGAAALFFSTQNLPIRMPTPAIMVQWLPHASQASPGLAPLPVETFSERRKPIQRSTAKPQPPVEAQATERAERAPEIASPPVATNTTESTAATATSASPHSNGITEARQPHFSEPRFDADYLSNPAPAYPALSRRLGEEGKVILRVFVESSGQPGQIELKASSGSPRLDRAAQEAIRHWKFIPASRGQEAVGAWVLVPIVFTLKG